MAYLNTRALYEASGWVDHTHEVMHQVRDLRAAMLDAETGQRGYLLTRDPAFLGPYRNARARAEGYLARITELTTDNPTQQDRLPVLRTQIEAHFDAMQANIVAPPAETVVRSAALNRGRVQMDEIRARLSEMDEEEKKLLAARTADARDSYWRSKSTFAVATLLAAGVLVGAFLLVRRDLAARQRAEDEIRESERFGRLVLDSTTEGIYGIDPGGACKFINAAGARLLGYGPAELIGRQVHAAVHHSRPDGTAFPAEECEIARAARDGLPVRKEDVLWRKDGTPLPVDYSVSPIQDGGRTVGAVVTFANLSELRRAAAEKREQQEQFQTMVNSITQLAWIAEPSGDVSWYNRRWYEYTGTTFNEMKGWGWRAVHDPGRVEAVHVTLA